MSPATRMVPVPLSVVLSSPMVVVRAAWLTTVSITLLRTSCAIGLSSGWDDGGQYTPIMVSGGHAGSMICACIMCPLSASFSAGVVMWHPHSIKVFLTAMTTPALAGQSLGLVVETLTTYSFNTFLSVVALRLQCLSLVSVSTITSGFSLCTRSCTASQLLLMPLTFSVQTFRCAFRGTLTQDVCWSCFAFVGQVRLLQGVALCLFLLLPLLAVCSLWVELSMLVVVACIVVLLCALFVLVHECALWVEGF